MVMRFILYIIIFGVATPMIAQKNNLVTEPKLKLELYTYLINNSTYEMFDSLDVKIPISNIFTKSTGIASGILKTDSILTDKSLVGIYSFRFTCFDCHNYLYFQHPSGKREYVNFFDKSFDVWKTITKSEKFLRKYCSKYSEAEILKTMQEIIKIMYASRSYVWPTNH
jgi:hypothetical protein